MKHPQRRRVRTALAERLVAEIDAVAALGLESGVAKAHAVVEELRAHLAEENRRSARVALAGALVRVAALSAARGWQIDAAPPAREALELARSLRADPAADDGVTAREFALFLAPLVEVFALIGEPALARTLVVEALEATEIAGSPPAYQGRDAVAAAVHDVGAPSLRVPLPSTWRPRRSVPPAGDPIQRLYLAGVRHAESGRFDAAAAAFAKAVARAEDVPADAEGDEPLVRTEAAAMAYWWQAITVDAAGDHGRAWTLARRGLHAGLTLRPAAHERRAAGAEGELPRDPAGPVVTPDWLLAAMIDAARHAMRADDLDGSLRLLDDAIARASTATGPEVQRLDGLLHSLKAEAMLAPVLRHRKRQRTSFLYRRSKVPPPFPVDDIAAVARTAATGQVAAVESTTGPAAVARLELVRTLLLTASMWLLDGRTLDACFDLAAAGRHLAKVLPLGSATLMRAHQMARHLISVAPGDVLQARVAEGWPYP